jgi:hypothetical protein
VCADAVQKTPSWEMTTAQPAKFSSPSSNARSVFTSMSLVGSSSNSTLARLEREARCIGCAHHPKVRRTVFS